MSCALANCDGHFNYPVMFYGRMNEMINRMIDYGKKKY